MVLNPLSRIHSDDPLYLQYSDPSISRQHFPQLLDLMAYVGLGRLGNPEDNHCLRHFLNLSARSGIAALLQSKLWSNRVRSYISLDGIMPIRPWCIHFGVWSSFVWQWSTSHSPQNLQPVSIPRSFKSQLCVPSSKILHSFRSLLESSSSFASIMRLLFFFSSSSPSWELWQAPMVYQALVEAITRLVCISNPSDWGLSRLLPATQLQSLLYEGVAQRLSWEKVRQRRWRKVCVPIGKPAGPEHEYPSFAGRQG